MRNIWFAISLVCLSLLLSCGASESVNRRARTFCFAAFPEDNESVLRALFDPTAKYLSQELGLEVVYIPVTKNSLSVASKRQPMREE